MKKLLLLIGLILAVVLAYYCLSDHAPKIQGDIKSRLATSFENKNISENVEMAVSGRDVTLTGTVADEAVKTDAGNTAKALYGVRSVDNKINVADAPSYQSEVILMDEPDLPMPAVEETPELNLDLMGSPEVEMATAEMTLETEPPVVTLEEPTLVIEEPAPVINDLANKLENATLDGPLKITNGRVIRRNVKIYTTVEAECEGNLTGLLSGNKIHFETASAKIKRSSYDLLDRIIVAAKNCDDNTIITVNGYTDNVGNAEYNRQLSIKRARAVGTYMLKRGVAKQVKVVGNGANDPIASNDTEEGRAQNRRIEFKVFKKSN